MHCIALFIIGQVAGSGALSGSLPDLAFHARTRAASVRDARRTRQAGRARRAERGRLDGLPLRVSSQPHTSFSRVAWLILECARRTRPFPGRAFREQEDDQVAHPILPSSPVISQGWGLIDLPLRVAFSPAHPLARRDVPLARARAFNSLYLSSRGVAEAALYCAHRATTASSWGLCEQEGHLATPLLQPPQVPADRYKHFSVPLPCGFLSPLLE